jgi:hypothetical protein
MLHMLKEMKLMLEVVLHMPKEFILQPQEIILTLKVIKLML